MACLSIAACSSEMPESTVEWGVVSAQDFLGDVEVAVYLGSTIYEERSSAQGAVAFVDSEGRVRLLETEAQDNGLITFGAAGLAWSGVSTSSFVGGGSSRTLERGQTSDTGHWSGTTPGGRIVQIFNTGVGEDGYASDVFGFLGEQVSHAIVPDVPGAAGVMGEDVWLLNAGSSTLGGQVSAYRVEPEAKGVVTPTSTWRHWGAGHRAEFSHASQLFARQGDLVFLEEFHSQDESGDYVGPVQLRLAELDPLTGAYRSSALLTEPDSIVAGGPAGRDEGHVEGDRLYRLGSKGRILRVDLADRSISSLGTVSTQAAESDFSLTAWRDGRLYVMFAPKSGDDAILETYSLDSGDRLTATPVSGLAKAFRGDSAALPWGLTVVNPTD